MTQSVQLVIISFSRLIISYLAEIVVIVHDEVTDICRNVVSCQFVQGRSGGVY